MPKRPKVRAQLLDYGWLEARLGAKGVDALLADFDAVAGDGGDPELRLVQAALRLAAHALAEHPEELPGQLVGRLLHRTEPAVAALRERARPAARRPWLRPLVSGLAPAGGAMLRTLTCLATNFSALAVLPDGRAVSASWDSTLRVWDLATG
ncbi:MAG TPA: hypothetical protein VHG32_18715 [Thermoanaerobaculia bacterium]|nr:hypothetical protein [Thermoanaerobaculia bacterium]